MKKIAEMYVSVVGDGTKDCSMLLDYSCKSKAMGQATPSKFFLDCAKTRLAEAEQAQKCLDDMMKMHHSDPDCWEAFMHNLWMEKHIHMLHELHYRISQMS